MKILRTQSGTVILLVVLIIAVVLVTVIAFSNFIIQGIQQSRLIDSSIQAYYLAETGSERALFQSRRREAVKPADCPIGFICDPDGFCGTTKIPCINEDKGSLNFPLQDWQVDVSNEDEFTVYLREGESFQIDLFNPYDTKSPIEFDQFKVSRSQDASIFLYGELINLSWLVGDLDCPNPQSKSPVGRDLLTLPYTGPDQPATTAYLSNLDHISIKPNCTYIIRVSNTVFPGAEADFFSISLYDDIGVGEKNLVPIPSRLIIESKATFGRSQQKITVRSATRPPLSGLYDFVMFSEQEIVK